MIKKILAVIFVLFLAQNISAQYTIKGQVFDQKSMSALPNVTILQEGNPKNVTTDIDGNFSVTINKIPAIITFHLMGYIEQKLEINQNDLSTPINIYLHEKIMLLDEVILSTPFNQHQSENVVKVSYKSLNSMQNKGIQNLTEGLAQLPGVNQMTTGAGIGKPVIRGLTGSRVLVYNQGVRVENFQFGEKHGLGINDSGIESVEVIKGPASLLYGSDALGGVIYLTPEKYAKPSDFSARLSGKWFGNTQGFQTNIGIKKSFEKLQFLAGASLQKHADYMTPDELRITNSRYNDQDFKAGIGYHTKEWQIDLRYNYNTAQNGIAKAIDENVQNTSYEVVGLQQDLDNHFVSIKNHFNINQFKIKTNLGYTAHHRILKTPTGEERIGMDLNTINYDLKLYLPEWGKSKSIVGVQGLIQNNENFGTGYLLPDAAINGIGFFGTLFHDFDLLSLQAGIRYDFRDIKTYDIGTLASTNYRPGFEKDLSSFSGSLGLKKLWSAGFTTRLNLATGYRAPNLSELASKGQHEGRIEIGNQNINNETNLQADIALEYSHSHVEVFANAFYNQIYNYIFLAPTGSFQDDLAVYQYAQDNAYLYGGEAGIHLHPHPLDWLHLESSFEYVIGKKQDESYLPLIPVPQWDNYLRINFNDYKRLSNIFFNIGIAHSFKADKISDFEEERPAYSLLNSSIGTAFYLNGIKAQVRISGHNLLDKKYISHLSVLGEEEIPNMGRNLMLQLNFEF